MNYPKELSYAKTHEWVRKDGDTYIIGITDYAQHALGDVVFVNLPQEGDEVTAAESFGDVESVESFGDVESVKAVSDIMSPVSGTICAVNEELADSPELLNSDPYGAWPPTVNGRKGGDCVGIQALEGKAILEERCGRGWAGYVCSTGNTET